MTLLSQQHRHCLARWLRLTGLIALTLIPTQGLTLRQDLADSQADIARYAQATPDDAITRLQQKIDSGRITLAYDGVRGYLPAVLKALQIPVSSQMLVFSKTSVHRDFISRHNPRSLFFNDDSYIGWVPHAPVVEAVSVDPKLGPVYYVLLQRPKAKPRFVRNIEACLECHNGPMTANVPGHLMRSVYASAEGTPLLGARSYLTTDASPLAERWGGWYVTGKHGGQRHMGNGVATIHGDTAKLDRDKGANIADLRRFIDTKTYMTPYSDIVALMVLGHQLQLQNLIIRANYETQHALSPDPAGNQDTMHPSRQLGDDAMDRIKTACEPVVKAMLFAGETRLTAPIVGTSGFAEQFAAQGPHDRRGRSLRRLDLKSRLLRYPCSFTIYSEAFDALPEPAKDYIYRRLWEVLSGQDRTQTFARLSATDRKAVREILLQTKPAFAAWRARHPAIERDKTLTSP